MYARDNNNRKEEKNYARKFAIKCSVPIVTHGLIKTSQCRIGAVFISLPGTCNDFARNEMKKIINVNVTILIIFFFLGQAAIFAANSSTILTIQFGIQYIVFALFVIPFLTLLLFLRLFAVLKWNS